MSFGIERFDSTRFPIHAAAAITRDLSGCSSVVLTGGTTAENVYPALAETGAGWSGIEVFFSDERCVPPDDPASNYGMASRLLLGPLDVSSVHRMRGEAAPEDAAREYSEVVAARAPGGFDLVLLGMGADCHVAALFPGSAALSEGSALCRAVDRPDGMKGLTLTPPALLGSRKVRLIVSGEDKAEAVRRVVAGDEPPQECPARLLADHPDVNFLLDDPAASLL